MPQGYDVVIADTSCFILLDKVDALDLLRQVFNEITTTNTIAHEFGKPLPDWVKIQTIKNKHYQELLELEIDEGEASAISLAMEKETALLILDDLKARKVAGKLGLSFTGTLGVLLKAKDRGIIGAVRPILERVQLTNFRFSKNVFEEILRVADEQP